MQLARASAPAVAFKRVNGLKPLPVAARPLGVSARTLLARATDPSDAASAALDKAASIAKDAAAQAKDAATSAVSKAKSAINQATLDVDIKQLLRYNFLVQLGLTAVSWAVIFLTSHVNLAKGAGALNPVTLVLLLGVAAAAYSTYLSFTYLAKTKEEGLGALEGWGTLNKFYEHMFINFAGAAAALTALFANLGTLMVKKSGSVTLEALSQAASNTLLAHLVSLAFLVVLTRKITQAYQKLADWTAQLDALKASIPKLG